MAFLLPSLDLVKLIEVLNKKQWQACIASFMHALNNSKKVLELLYLQSMKFIVFLSEAIMFLRENFRMDTMKFLKFDIPIMALTATATTRVREDILQSLHMSKATQIVLTSFFWSNLRFLIWNEHFLL
ncbi:hypothetical protein R3W88_002969 [Solanum pinnatisectum]|uniref:Uncharacterized protein n=1 Tax=Solanum pinnatisectum TaxID=50273 RepID=A0AAV9MRC7_9SOLN|nr:hypothetical protein R3W88_002969 [Solanum pinnatisectum]